MGQALQASLNEMHWNFVFTFVHMDKKNTVLAYKKWS